MATESRTQAFEAAEEILAENRAVAARITKETLTPATGEFASMTVFSRGSPEQKVSKVVSECPSTPRCVSPSDLYAPQARKTLGRLLETWLSRKGVTIFELLHRPDLAEILDASGMELQHVIQKVAVPESQALGQSVHELVRHYQRLADQAVERLLTAGRKNLFPDLSAHSLNQIIAEILQQPERAFVMGGALARRLQGVSGAHARLDILLELVESAPAEGPGRNLVLGPVEQVLCEMLAHRPTLAGIVGPSLDHGGLLCAVVRMLARREVSALIRQDARLALVVPPIEGPSARLGERIAAGDLPLLAASLMQLVASELKTPRRLRPSDATAEIDVLRALAMMLTAASGRLLSPEEVQDAFSERSKILVTAEFVGQYAEGCKGPLEEAEVLTRLCENVTGIANKRSAARWLSASVGSLRFETAMRLPRVDGGPSPANRLGALAVLQKAVRSAALSEEDTEEVCGHIGRVGGLIEADAKMASGLARANAPLVARLAALLRMASGETAPLGAAAEAARTEAVKVMRQPQTRQALVGDAAGLGALKPLFKSAGLAA